MAVAKLQLERLAIHRGAITHTGDFERTRRIRSSSPSPGSRQASATCPTWNVRALCRHAALRRSRPLPCFTSTSSTRVSESWPFGPFTVTVCPSTVAVTFFGTGIGFLPIRDMVQNLLLPHAWRAGPRPPGQLTPFARLEHAAQNFAAHILGAGARIRHHALRRRQDRDTQGRSRSSAARPRSNKRGDQAWKPA